jgi:hypothetical protein
MRRRVASALLSAVLLAGSDDAAAQAINTSAASVGLAGAYTARARGFEAAGWNPANLGLADGPKWSLGLPAARGSFKSNSWSFSQFADTWGEFLDDAHKDELLDAIRRGDPDRRFTLEADADAQLLSASYWRFALSFGTVAAADVNFAGDLMEFVLFGNGGDEGAGADLDFSASDGDAWWISSVGLSYGQPIRIGGLERRGFDLALGITARYLMTHALGFANDRGSLLTEDPLTATVDAELVYSGDANGDGYAIDLGAALSWESWSFGLAFENLIGDVDWGQERFEFSSLVASTGFGVATAEEIKGRYLELSAEAQQRVDEYLEDADLARRMRLGAAYQPSQALVLSADYQEIIGGTLRLGWEHRLSAGAEWHPWTFLPLRVGLATDFDKVAIGAGLGLEVRPVYFDLSAGRQFLAAGDELALAVSLSIWPHGR